MYYNFRVPALLLPAFSLLAFVLPAFTTGADSTADQPPGVRCDLTSSGDLSDWIVTGCEAEFVDGAILLKSGDGFLRTHHRYQNFVLELQWRPLHDENWDSGIYFRADLPPQGRPWPQRYQIDLRQGQEGSLVGNRRATAANLCLPGQWNRFKLTVRGKTASLEINGTPAWQVDDIDPVAGYIGLGAEVPGGGRFEFKDITVTELGFRPLFNGRDLSGWEGAGSPAESCWAVRDGLLTCTGGKGPWLRSIETFGDFNLRLQYRLKPGGNSGVYIRVPPSGNHHGQDAGIEVQILDDAADRYKNLKPYQYCGSLYAITPAEPRVGREAGQWNSLEINCRGRAYQVTHNGIVVVDARPEQYPELTRRLVQGHLGLQNHKEEVWFRQIRVGDSQ